MTPADERRNLAIVYVNIALYALCYQLQRPVEPFLVEQLTALYHKVAADDEEEKPKAKRTNRKIQGWNSSSLGVLRSTNSENDPFFGKSESEDAK